MEQHLYQPIHEEFRAMAAAFLAREAVPYHDQWERDGIVDRDVWRKAGKTGLLGMDVPEEYGGGGVPERRDETRWPRHAAPRFRLAYPQ